MKNIFKISTENTFSITSAFKWGGISLAYNIILLSISIITVKLLFNEKIFLLDRLGLNNNFWTKFVDTLISSPILETLLLVFLFKFFIKNKTNLHLSYLIVTIIFCVLHLITKNWMVALKITIYLQVQIYYLSKRINHASFCATWAEGAIMHFMYNAIAFIYSYYAMKYA